MRTVTSIPSKPPCGNCQLIDNVLFVTQFVFRFVTLTGFVVVSSLSTNSFIRYFSLPSLQLYSITLKKYVVPGIRLLTVTVFEEPL